jgi:tRNA(fMet)-specific endonuclease VapC
MAYLLDTNVCIVLINGTSPRTRARFAKAVESGEAVWIPSVSLYELWYGVAKSVQKRTNTLRLEKFLDGPVRLLEFGGEDARYAGEIRSQLERAGRPIGAYDLLIAGQALHRKLTLVTANAREFARVQGLLWQDWAA